MQNIVAFVKAAHNRWVLYLYPIMIFSIEISMKYLMYIDPGSVIGTSLASIGISFTIALIPKKTLTAKKLDQWRQTVTRTVYNQQAPEYIAGTKLLADEREEQSRNVGLAATVLLTIVWAIILVLTIGPLKSTPWANIVTFFLGLLSAIIGVALTEWSERKNG